MRMMEKSGIDKRVERRHYHSFASGRLITILWASPRHSLKNALNNISAREAGVWGLSTSIEPN